MDSPQSNRVFLGIPSYGQLESATCASILTASRNAFPYVAMESGSLLAYVFNRLWTGCLNNRDERDYTHFAMLHADLAPEAYWLDTMIEEMDRVGADVIGAVANIKDSRGLTSLGWQNPATGSITRFTLKQIASFPETFDAAAAGHPDDWLMLNTGLWVARLDRPWVEQFPGFNIIDKIFRNSEGKLVAHVLSEDWNWSTWMAQNGVKAFATRRVATSHYGKLAFRSDQVYGHDTDPGD